MGLPKAHRRYTVEEYLRMEQDSLEKHEYHEGEILAMAGGSTLHSKIISRINRLLGNGLKGGRCEVYDANLRVRTGTSGRFVYPDVSVICGPPLLVPTDGNSETVTNPTLVVEVISSSSEAYDRGEKFAHYRNIESLREYVLVSQNAPRIETFLKQEDGMWLFNAASGMDSIVKLRSIGVELPLADVYAGIDFRTEVEPPANAPSTAP